MLIGKLVRMFAKGRLYDNIQNYYSYSSLGYASRERHLERARRRMIERIGDYVDELAPGVVGEERKKLEDDICDCIRKYHIHPNEYFKFRFAEKSDAERGEFLTDDDRIIVKYKINSWRTWRVFNDKDKTAKKFASYYKRAVTEFTLPKDEARLEAFLNAHRNVIVKPLSEFGGKGVRKFNLEGADLHETVKEMTKFYCGLDDAKESKVVVEDLIVQDESIGRFHPQSVNTLRLITFRMKDRTIVFHPIFRIGCGGSVVDNSCSGGLFCAIDPDTGVSLAAANSHFESFTEHPDTHVALIGFKIPRYEEAVALVKKAADVVPSCPYVGWDLALTKDGWVLVEANHNPALSAQVALQKGIKKEFYALARELGVKC